MGKIICLIDNLGSGGAQRQMVSLASLWHNQGFDIEFIVYNKNDFFRNKLDELNIPVNTVYVNNNLRRIFGVGKLLKRKKPDIVVSFLATPNFIACIVKCVCFFKWRLITSERSAKEDELLSRRGKFYAWFQRYSDAIVCNSENAKKMWLKNYPQYTSKLSVIYNPVIINCKNNTYLPRKRGKLSIVVAASYQQLKNPIGLIEGVNLLSDEEKGKICINWYGAKKVSLTGTLVYEDAKLRVKSYNLENILILNEETTQIANIMQQADVVGLFSSVEGLPNTICEAMTLGKPVIMTKVSDYRQIVDDSNGILCEWNDVSTIANSLKVLINKTDNELIQMGNASKHKADILFAQEVIVNKWINLFRK